jgi:hypothetical protein
MAMAVLGAFAPGYFPYAIEGSRLTFRGPERNLNAPFVGCFGGTQTFGRRVARPWPDLLEESCGARCINLAVRNGGIDTLLRDMVLRQALGSAAISVVEVPDAINLSNPYYRVHGLRNDRFLAASDRLKRLFPEVDFCRFQFTRHMIGTLHARSSERFVKLARGLRTVWHARMEEVLDLAQGRIILLRLADCLPAPKELALQSRSPALIGPRQLDRIAGRALALVDAGTASAEVQTATTEDWFRDNLLPTPADHASAAALLVPVLRAHLPRALAA